MDRFTKAMITNMKLNMDKNDEEVLPLIDNDSLQAENSMAMTITAEPLESDTSKRETEEKDQDAGSEDEDDDASKDEPKKSIWNGLREVCAVLLCSIVMICKFCVHFLQRLFPTRITTCASRFVTRNGKKVIVVCPPRTRTMR